MENDRLIGINQAAEMKNRLRQSLYLAIRKGRLKATRGPTGRVLIKESDLEAYWKSRYSREGALFNGERIHDIEKGIYSINFAAKFLKIPSQKLYHAIRMGYIPFVRKGSAYVLKKEDLLSYAKLHLLKQEEVSA